MRHPALWRPLRYGSTMVVTALVLVVPACLHSPEIDKIHYYAVIPEIHVAPATPTTLTLGVRPLFAKNTYSTAMAYLDDNYQLGYQSRHEWAENPAPIVTRAIQDALAASARFADVGNAADMARPDLLLTGELRAYRENRSLQPPQAELEVRLELRQATEPGSIWAETIRDTEPMKEDTPAALAESMTILVGRLAAHAASSIAAAPLPEKETNLGSTRPKEK